jgi:hypothetical protein
MIEQPKDLENVRRDELLSAKNLYQHDFLLLLLKDKCRLNIFVICAASAMLPGILFLSWWFVWIHTTTVWSIENTLSVLLQIFIIFPAIFLIYQLVPHSIAELFNTLQSNGVIGQPRKHSQPYENFVRQMVSWVDNGWWTLTILLLVLTYALYRLLLQEPLSSSPVPYWMRVCAIICYLPMMYATGISVVRLLLALIFTNWLFSRFTLQIKPLHPDGAGGLGVMTPLLWISVGLMLWEAMLLLASFLSRSLFWLSFSEMTLLAAIYVILTPALLIGWLIFPHRIMVRTRDELLQPLTDEYQRALLQSLSSNGYDTHTLVSGTRHLNALKQRYDLLHDTFPTWPLEFSTLNRIGVTIVLPLILPIITSLITLILHPLGL